MQHLKQPAADYRRHEDRSVSGTVAAIIADVRDQGMPAVLGRLRHYGSLFVGEEATVAYSDKVSGPNHILPTHRASRFTGGLWVGKFLKTVTYQRMDRQGSRLIAEHSEVEALVEGMVAHVRTARVRLDRYAPSEAT